MYVRSYVHIFTRAYIISIITCNIQHYTASNGSTSRTAAVHSIVIFQCNISNHKISDRSVVELNTSL